MCIHYFITFNIVDLFIQFMCYSKIVCIASFHLVNLFYSLIQKVLRKAVYS